MAIDGRTVKEIRNRTLAMWVEKSAHDDEFLRLTRRKKERGHSMADFVDERTTSLLQAHFVTRFERGKGGTRRARSMGDVWLHSRGIFNPINIKSGVAGANGQPNLVSLKKLLRSLLANQVDSYYLLFVKFEINESVQPKVLLVDLLDHLDWTTYDDGPGQIMLLEQKFFDAMDRGLSAISPPLVEKIDRLYAMLVDGNERLITNRRRTIKTFRKATERYKATLSHVIDQASLGFTHESDED